MNSKLTFHDIIRIRCMLGQSRHTFITQAQFAREIGVTCVTINRWENNRAKPSHLAELKLRELAKRAGMSL